MPDNQINNAAVDVFSFDSNRSQSQQNNGEKAVKDEVDKPNWEEQIIQKREDREVESEIEVRKQRIEMDFSGDGEQELQALYVRMSNANGAAKDRLQALYDKMKFRNAEIESAKENKEKMEQVAVSQMNISDGASANIEEINSQKIAVALFNDTQQSALILAKIAKGFFDSQGNQISDDESHKSTIWQVANENIAQASSAVATVFDGLKQAGFRVESKSHQQDDKSAVVYGISLPQGFVIDDIFTMGQERFAEMLRADKEQNKDQKEKMSFKVLGSMEVAQLSELVSKAAQEFTQVVENVVENVEEATRHFRDRFPSNAGQSTENSNSFSR